jgi:hypothetical protein
VISKEQISKFLASIVRLQVPTAEKPTVSTGIYFCDDITGDYLSKPPTGSTLSMVMGPDTEELAKTMRVALITVLESAITKIMLTDEQSKEPAKAEPKKKKEPVKGLKKKET